MSREEKDNRSLAFMDEHTFRCQVITYGEVRKKMGTGNVYEEIMGAGGDRGEWI